MRKYILLFIALCLHIAARGQTIADIDLSGLPQPTQAKALRYWFDDDAGSVQTVNGLSGKYELDMSSLLDGLHTIHYHVVGSDGQPYYVASSIFIKTGTNTGSETLTASKLMYWFDDETTIQYVDITDGTQVLDASRLIEGLHTIHYQVLCNNGEMTSAMSSIFLRMSMETEVSAAQSFRYWFDDEQTVTETAITDGVQLLDASRLLTGLHTVHYQIVDTKGLLGAPVSSVFLKTDEQGTMTEAKSIRYWFDDDVSSVNITDVANGTQTLDVSTLPVGLHTLCYQLIDSEGKVSAPVTRIFMKDFRMVSEGENRITKYQYWQNNSATVQTVTLDAAVNPCTLIALLPMQKESIRSKCFHFEVKDGKPMMYAKNDFHVRFTDRAGYFIDDSRQFIDYSVAQKVEPVGELQNTQTFPKVAANDVRWYTMEVTPGDTAAFKLNQPATVQVFAPSGAEVFKTSESASVNWSGIHVWEEGTYYLAVHDVTGSKDNMTLDYMHMDKYDVVDWDVHTVGNGGCSTITFKGNGFRDLYAVDLVVAPGDTIYSVDISHDSDAETAVTFDFTDAALGDYNAVFHFTEEDKPVANVVMVEEAVDIELATDVSFPSSFLRGTSTTYTIKITNKGNMTAYQVPLFIYLESPGTGLPLIMIRGLDIPNLYDYLNTDGLTDEEKQAFKEFSDNIQDSHLLIPAGVDNGRSIWSGIVNASIPPESTKNILVNANSDGMISVYVSTPDSWDGLTNKKDNLKHKYCCIHDQLECFLDGVSLTADEIALATLGATAGTGAAVSAGAKIVGCVSNALGTLSSYTSMLICDTDKPLAEKILSFNGLKSGLSTIGTLASCGVFNKIQRFNDFVDAAGNWRLAPSFVQAGMDCVPALTQKPDCYPTVYGGTSTPYVPVDPNDIYGYLSEAGSKFIADSVAMVNYTIEFENDTTFATTAAHTIVIKDTLDSRYFDLTKFMPTGVRIGGHDVFLDEADVVTNNDKTSFVKTIDMRPEINAIAQVEGEYNQKNGIATWAFTSLDPMTMEPTDDLMQGILPVNYDGTSGIGEVMFNVSLKKRFPDGTDISNRAGIVFDYEEAILTPTWTNIVDAVTPTSSVEYTSTEKTDTVTLHFAGEDNRSGVWHYTVYAQDGKNAPWHEVGVTDSCAFDYKYAEGIDYGFCVLATDSAGNVEQKELAREAELRTFIDGDANSDGVVDTKDAVLVISYYLGLPGTYLNMSAADIVEDGVIDTKDAVAIIDKYLNTSTGPKAIKNRKRIRVL